MFYLKLIRNYGDYMELIAKTFTELSVDELYEIIKSRAEVFLLEQGIVCQDLDDVDRDSLHCFFADGGRVVAYLRGFRSGEDAVTIGRVLTLDHGKGIGTQLMKKSIEEIKNRYGCTKVCLHAQKQAVRFYEKLGFEVVSDEFLEEGVVHVSMEKHI